MRSTVPVIAVGFALLFWAAQALRGPTGAGWTAAGAALSALALYGSIRMAVGWVDAHKRLDAIGRTKDEFYFEIAHEFRNPLTSISGFAETLRRLSGKLSREREQEYLAIIVKEAERLARIVDEHVRRHEQRQAATDGTAWTDGQAACGPPGP